MGWLLLEEKNGSVDKVFEKDGIKLETMMFSYLWDVLDGSGVVSAAVAARIRDG